MKIIGRPIALSALAAVLAFIITLSSSDTVHASFTPKLAITIANNTPGASSDIGFDFSLPAGDVIFAGVVVFVPSEWGITDGRDIPVGAEVGVIRADATLGLIGSACNQVLPVEFKMKNASLDESKTVTFEDTDANQTADFAEDGDGNGIIDGIDRWPEPIRRILSETEAAPIRRYAGMAIIAGAPILLQLLIFEPGTFFGDNIPDDPALGYPVITMLQNGGDPDIEPKPGPITNFCSPLSTRSTFYGITRDNPDTENVDEGGHTLLINPDDGIYTFTVVASGLRDADGDGFENLLDTCPLQINVGNPRVTNDGDLDSDGIDAVCDPNDDPLTDGRRQDQDGDGYINRQDNCPLVANGQDTTNQADEDMDQIGDVCDPNPNDADTEGEISFAQVSQDVTIGTGVTDPDATPISTASEPIVDAGGSDTKLIAGIIAGVLAAVAIVGGGAALMMRRSD